MMAENSLADQFGFTCPLRAGMEAQVAGRGRRTLVTHMGAGWESREANGANKQETAARRPLSARSRAALR